MVIFFVVIWKHVWRIIVYKVKEKKSRDPLVVIDLEDFMDLIK